MTVYDVILIGIALAMDAFAITVANCAAYGKTLTKKQAWSMPIAFALFQFLMPVTGYYIGSLFAEYIGGVSKFLTAAIFFALSLKIVIDNLKKPRAEVTERQDAADRAVAAAGTAGEGGSGVKDTSAESAKNRGAGCACPAHKDATLKFSVLILQAVATSIDALIIGVTFAAELSFSVFFAGGIIGTVTFILVAAALLFGKYLDRLFGKYAEWLGAVILFALAVKNLAEGLV